MSPAQAAEAIWKWEDWKTRIEALNSMTAARAAEIVWTYEPERQRIVFLHIEYPRATEMIWQYDWNRRIEIFKVMSPTYVHDILYNRPSWEDRIEALNRMTATRAGEVIWAGDWPRRVEMIDHMSAGRAAEVLTAIEYPPGEYRPCRDEFIKRMTARRAAEILRQYSPEVREFLLRNHPNQAHAADIREALKQLK
jgi:Mg/Co/Ni transporter MgtE